MSRLFRRANAPIFTVTPDGVVVAWNDHLAQMSGVAEDLAIGGSIFALATEDSRQCLGAAMDSCANGLSSSAVEVSMPGSAEDPMSTVVRYRGSPSHFGLWSLTGVNAAWARLCPIVFP